MRGLWCLLRLAVRVERLCVHRRDRRRRCRCGSFFACGGCWGCTCVRPFLWCGLLKSTSMSLEGGERITLPCCLWPPSSWELLCSPDLGSGVPGSTLPETPQVFARSQALGEEASDLDPSAEGRQPWDRPASSAEAFQVAVVHAIGRSFDRCA